MRCQFCGSEIPEDSAFCPECGKEQPPRTTVNDTQEMPKFCENCGAPIEPGAVFCAGCGSRVGAAPGQQGGTGSQAGAGWQGVPYNGPGNGEYAQPPRPPYGPEDYDDGDYGEDPFPDEPENTGKKKNIPLIIAIVVICIVLIAGIGIAVKLLVFDKNDKNGDGDGRSSAITREDEEDSAEDEEEAQPDADYDLTEDSWQTLTGEIDESGGEKYLSLDRSSSFYGQDDMADEEVLVEDVDRVMIDDSFLPDGMLDDALYEAVSMSGEVRISDGELSITVETVEDESGDDMIAAYEEAQDTEEGGIHRYELIVKDCTWEEAFEECRNRGGYLARINSQEEMEYIIAQMFDEGLDGTNFFLGGRRDEDSRDYYWVDEDNQCYGEKLNDIGYSCYDYWMIGEPSFEDLNMDIQECYMNLFYYEEEGRTVINDVPNDVISIVPSYSGHVGFICEYED